MRDLTPVLEIIQSRILLSDIIRSDVNLKRKGKTFLGCCPFHKEKTPSFSVDDEKGRYHCFGCGASGDVFNYFQEKRGFAFIDAVEHLANQIGVELPQQEKNKKISGTDRSYEILQKATLWMQNQLTLSTGEKAREYLEKRKISKESESIFKLGYTPISKDALFQEFRKDYSIEELIKVGLVTLTENDKRPIDRFRGRLMFPICDRKGSVIAFGGRALLEDSQPKYLNSAETPLFSKSKILYAHHLSQKNVTSVTGYLVVEGYLDVITLHQNGFNTAVAPLGTALTEEHIQLLWRHQVPPILCFDGDKAGYDAAIRSAQRILPNISQIHRLNFAFLPEGEDPDSFVQKNKDLFIKFIKNPSPLSDVLWKHFKETLPFKTPEDQANFKKTLKETVNIIKNEDVKDAYKDFFNTHFLNLKEDLKPKRIFKKEAKDSFSVQLKKPVDQNKDFIFLQKIILATLVFHPYLIDQVSDSLTTIHFDESLNDIVDFILRCDDLRDRESVLLKAKEMGLINSLNIIIDEKVLAKAPFIRKLEESHVLLGWQEIFNRLEYSLNLNSEVVLAAKALKKDFDEDKWKRIKELHSLKTRGLTE